MPLDFSHQNIRGRSFRGVNLANADFSYADIRGADFTDAILIGANFTGAKAGLKGKAVIVLLAGMFLLALLSGYISALVGYQTTYSFHPDNLGDAVIPYGIVVIVIVAVFSGIATSQGLEAAFGALAIALTLGFFVAPVGALISALVLLGVITGALAVAGTVTIGSFTAGIIAIASILSVSEYTAVSISLDIARKSGSGSFGTLVAETIGFAIAFAAAIPLLSSYIGWQAAQEDDRFTLIWRIVVALTVIGGNTSFRGADLTNADFTRAQLKGTDLRGAKITHTCWFDAKNLHQARAGNTILIEPLVRELVVTGIGNRGFLTNLNLEEAYLEGVDLSDANLTGSNLCRAILREANLDRTNLSRVQALGTDFTGAKFTGACLESWNIDSSTHLEDISCQYVYLLRGKGERRPSSGVFVGNEFTKLFQEVLSTVDLIFRNGVDWRAFVTAFNAVQVENDGSELIIQSIENKGDGVIVVRVSVPPQTSKEYIHSEFSRYYDTALHALEAQYQAELKAKEGEIARYREQSANMWGVINSLANRPINVQAIAKAMNESKDQSQNFSVGGDFTITSTNSIVNLRDISGTVTYTINQLPESSNPAEPGIRELLSQLQKLVEEDTELALEDKADLLEQVKALAETEQVPEQDKKEGIVRKARKIFEATLKGLPDTARIVEACSKLLPMVIKALGLPV